MMQTGAKISVVMPTYNHAHYIEAAIQSVLLQTFTGFELIVIDNYSDDGTEDIVLNLNDSRIRYEKFRNNGIIGASRNHGMMLAKNYLIAFLDSDDSWHPDKLKKSIDTFERIPHIIALCHAENEVRDDQVIRVLENTAYVGDLYEKLLFHRNYLSTSATVIKRESGLSIGGFSEKPEFVGVEDYDFWIRLAKLGSIALLPDVLGNFRLHENNFTANRERLANRVLVMLDTHYAAIPASLLSGKRRDISRRRARVMASCGVRLIQQGKLRGLPWLVKAIEAALA